MESSIHVALTRITWRMSLKIMTTRAIISPEVFIRESCFDADKREIPNQNNAKYKKENIATTMYLLYFSRPAFLKLDKLQT